VIDVWGKTFNVGYKKVVKHDLLWYVKKRVVLGDYTLDLKRDQSHEGSSQIKTLIIVEDHQETTNTYNSHLIIGRRAKVRRRMVMDEMEGRIRGQDRSRNIQSSKGGSSRRDEISRDPLPMDTLQSGRHRSRPSSPTTNRIIQTSRDALQSTRHSTSYDLRDNNRRTPTSRDALQSARFSTSHDPRENNRRT
jgi:hypothetical protein